MSVAKEFIEQREKEAIKFADGVSKLSAYEVRLIRLGFSYGMQCANDYHDTLNKVFKGKP